MPSTISSLKNIQIIKRSMPVGDVMNMSWQIGWHLCCQIKSGFFRLDAVWGIWSSGFGDNTEAVLT